ncbi:hypothetical protein [Ascidiaceihabitans sp.]|uniref:hypothetical protein n=1 Tax=Ascidiaceihabitans sp. TaxID=1872644 RepID=UPI0032992A6A
MMKKVHPKININRLREIGWSLWDPIGLNQTMGGWKGRPFEDEYDTYLAKAAGMLRNNSDFAEVVDYLFFIQSQHIGMGPKEIDLRIRTKLLAVVQAISDDPLIWCEP